MPKNRMQTAINESAPVKKGARRPATRQPTPKRTPPPKKKKSSTSSNISKAGNVLATVAQGMKPSTTRNSAPASRAVQARNTGVKRRR